MTQINSKAVRAVLTAAFGLRAGFPILFTTAVWGGAVRFLPGAYTGFSIWYLTALGVVAGMGFRFSCATPRAYLIPGLREYSRLIRFTLLLVVSCAVAAGSGNPGTVPALLAILWICALAGFYVAGLSRHIVAPLFAGGLLGGGFVAAVATEIDSYLRQYREIIRLDPWWAVLLLLNVPLTVWIWRRIGTERDLTYVRPGTGAFSSWLEARSRKKLLGSPRGSRPSPASVQNAIRFLSFNPGSFAGGATWRGNLTSMLIWSCIVAFHFRDAKTGWFAAFQLALALPLLEGCFLSASARMFMLPLRRSEIIRRLAAGRSLAQLRCWATVALPITVGALLKGAALPTVCLALGATLAAQLPTFGLMLWAGSRKTASGIRYTAFMAPVLFVAATALSVWWTEPRIVAGTLLLSLPLGPLLIWLAYRRWLNTEVGVWASVSPKS